MKKYLLLIMVVLLASSGAKVMAATLDEALNVTGGNISFVSTGSYPWLVVTEGDLTYAQSGNAGVASSVSTLTATVTVTRKSFLSFKFKAWGEGTDPVWDKCVFALDGEVQFTYGAYKNSWVTYEVGLEVGEHTLSWTYDKDSSLNPEGDYFAVDDVAISATTMESIIGDVNQDGHVTIGDVTALIDYLLDGNDEGINLGNADMTRDGNVSIGDVTALIDYLLSGPQEPVSYTVGGVTFTMMPVRSGTFRMGATEEQGDDAYDWEKPSHEVTLRNPIILPRPR